MEHPLKASRKPAVKARTGLSDSSMYEAMERGTFPKPIKIGPKAVAWLDHEIDAWLEARIAERDGVANG
jgi:prophage regulatory protein